MPGKRNYRPDPQASEQIDRLLSLAVFKSELLKLVLTHRHLSAQLAGVLPADERARAELGLAQCEATIVRAD